MGWGSRGRTRLRALQRSVWGDRIYEQHASRRTRRQQRLSAVVVTAIGGQLVLTAVGLVLISSAASAHTSTINISCTEVEFVYRNFPNVTATAHESVVINGIETASRDITFQGPETTDTVTIALGSGSNTVAASDHWAYKGKPQGSASATQTLTYCHSSSTTTIGHESSTTSSSTTSTSSTTSSTTTSTSVLVSSTSSSTPSTVSTTSTVPETSTSTSSTSVPATSTSSVSTTTSTSGATSTTTGPETSTTIHELGSTTTTIGATTSSTIHQQVSTSTTTSNGKLPVTGLSGLSIPAALGALGVGILAVGLTRLRRAIARS
jgi:hypothetical protein